MLTRLIIVLATALAIGSDTADVNRYKSHLVPGEPDFSGAPANNPEVFLSVQQPASSKQCPLQPQSPVEIIHYVSGEFATALKQIPSGKKGLRIEVGKKIDDKDLRAVLQGQTPAANVGAPVPVTAT